MSNNTIIEKRHPVIVSHRQDIDGVFFAVVMYIYEKLVNDTKPSVLLVSNKDVNDVITREISAMNPSAIHLIIGDLNPKLELLKEISFKGVDITFIDHHSGEKELHDQLRDSRIETHISYDYCAARIAYLNFMSSSILSHPNVKLNIQTILDILTQYVNDRDLYQEKIQDSVQLHVLYNLYGPENLYQLFVDHVLNFAEDGIIPENLVATVDALLVYRRRYIKEKLKGRIVADRFAVTNETWVKDIAKCLEIDTETQFVILSAEQYESDIARFILDTEIPVYDPKIVFIFNELRGILRIVTSNDLPIASKIARHLGGNGHDFAAAVSIRHNDLKPAINALHELYRDHYYLLEIPEEIILEWVK